MQVIIFMTPVPCILKPRWKKMIQSFSDINNKPDVTFLISCHRNDIIKEEANQSNIHVAFFYSNRIAMYESIVCGHIATM
jgi:hypothetical protein